MSMIRKCTRGVLVLALVIGLVDAATAADEKKMTRDEYKAKVAEYDQRAAAAPAAVAELDADLARLTKEIAGLDADIARLDAEALSIAGSTQAAVNTRGRELDALVRQLQGLTALAPEELFHHRGEIADVAEQVTALSSEQVSCLPELSTKTARINSLLASLNGRMPRQFSVNYEVAKGDHLWGISSKEEIYADPYMWPRLYRANREQINDPDMIYPKQVLTVPFGVAENQYLVTSGDFLSGIASAVYDDPTQWHRIYKANATQIVEPNMIFPAQVLEIPSN